VSLAALLADVSELLNVIKLKTKLNRPEFDTALLTLYQRV